MSNVFFNGHTVVDVVNPAGLGGYSNKSQAELEHKYGPLVIISLDEAVQKIEERAKSLPIEVDADEWDRSLNVLPPMKWIRAGDTESFRICEATCGMIHATYVRMGNRYFCMNRPLSETHAALVALVESTLAASATRH